MIYSKKAVANSLIFSLIVLTLCVVVYFAIFGRTVNTAVIEECRGSCVDSHAKCTNLGGTVISSRCIKEGELEKGKICCLTMSDLAKKEPDEPAKPDSSDTVTSSKTCNSTNFPIFTQLDPNHRYVCLDENKARPCNIPTNRTLADFDACQTPDKTHPVYLQCCKSDQNINDAGTSTTTPSQEPQAYVRPAVDVEVGSARYILTDTALFTNFKYEMKVYSFGTDVKRCRIGLYDTNTYQLFESNTMGVYEEVEGNCDGVDIVLEPTIEDYEKFLELQISHAILRIVLDVEDSSPFVKTYFLSLVRPN
jgi:hypothetical protein